MEQITSTTEYYAKLAKIETYIEKGFEKLNETETAELAQLS